MRKVVIPDGIRKIGNCAFFHCESLEEIEIPDSVTSMGYDAFGGCGSLKKVVLPKTLEMVGPGVFNNCCKLKIKSLSHRYQVYEDCLLIDTKEKRLISCYKEKSHIRIPKSVEIIDHGAFAGCTSLKDVVIPKSVTHIGSGAFACCDSLTTIKLPGSVLWIGIEAFRGDEKKHFIVPKGQLRKFRDLLRMSWNYGGNTISEGKG